MFAPYEVFYHACFLSPLEMKFWLNQMYNEGLELVAIQAEYFVFKRCTTDNAD